MLIAAAIPVAAQAQEHPLATARKVTVRGRIERVQLAMGEGMPMLELTTSDGKRRRIMLGSMRYLMEKNFNPKAGQEAIVTGFEQPEFVVAQTVEIPAAKLVLALRKADGTPLWRRGGNSRKKN
jgi:hypothetical protein